MLYRPCPIQSWIGLLVQNIYRRARMLLGHVSMEIFILGMVGGPSRTFLVGGCIDLVCQAEQPRFLIAISLHLGRHTRALGVVCKCTSFVFCFFGLGWGIGAWQVVGFWPLFHPVRGPFILQARWREGFGWLPLTGLSWIPYASGSV